VVGLATCGGAGGVSGWWLEREKERERKKLQKRGVEGLVLVDFEPEFFSYSGHEIHPYL
jgi:hypothetical protein